MALASLLSEPRGEAAESLLLNKLPHHAPKDAITLAGTSHADASVMRKA